MQMQYDSKQILDNFSSTCRFCLSQDDCVSILNDDQIADHLQAATEFILSKVDENDGLPNSICQRCLRCVVDFAELEARCQQTYEILNQILNDEQPEEYRDGERENPADDEEPEQELEEQEIELLEEEEPVISEPSSSCRKEAEQCPICGKLVVYLKRHMAIHSTTKRYACSHCPKRFRHDTTLKRHVNSIHLRLKQVYCPFEGCSAGFTDPSCLKYHVTVKHWNAKDHVCPECGKAFHTSTKLHQHVKMAHEERNYGCTQCGKVFALNFHLKAHMVTHSDERPFSCSFCDRSFKHKKNLTEHLINRHGQPKRQDKIK